MTAPAISDGINLKLSGKYHGHMKLNSMIKSDKCESRAVLIDKGTRNSCLEKQDERIKKLQLRREKYIRANLNLEDVQLNHQGIFSANSNGTFNISSSLPVVNILLSLTFVH